MHGSYTQLAIRQAREGAEVKRGEGFRAGAAARQAGLPADDTPVNAWLYEYAYREGYARGYSGRPFISDTWEDGSVDRFAKKVAP
jgi:hypothetical protein